MPEKSLEEKLVETHSKNVQTLTQRKAQLEGALKEIEAQILMLTGAIRGLNELLEIKRQVEVPAVATPEVPTDATTPQS
jgi:hypothetical protein